MNMELEPNDATENIKYQNKLDEAYGFMCLSISKDVLFPHLRIEDSEGDLGSSPYLV